MSRLYEYEMYMKSLDLKELDELEWSEYCVREKRKVILKKLGLSDDSQEQNKKPNKRCECGAQHTKFPNHHSNWCILSKEK